MFDIIQETEKAVKVEIKSIINKYNHVTEEDYTYIKTNYYWIPKSVCKIENNEVISIEHWFVKKYIY